MPNKGKYIAGKQVSRWEADTDNVDIEYKNLDTQSLASVPFFSGRKGCLLKILFLLVFLVVGLIIGYELRRNVHETVSQNQATTVKPPGIEQDYRDEIREQIQSDLEDTANYRDHIDEISRCVMLSGIGSTNKFIQYVTTFWSSFYIDSIKIKHYNVLLSYHNYTSKSSSISVLSSIPNTSVVFQATYNLSVKHPDYIPFNAYSPSGVVKSKLIYANYGSKRDFTRLKKLNVPIKDNIVLIKYGKIHPGNKVFHAQSEGAGGVILYPDPADYAHGHSDVFPKTWWLPGWAVPLSHVRYNLVGDPQTPGFPAIDGVPHTSEVNMSSIYPQIPVQPICYDDARYLMSQLGGQPAPDEWLGSLNVSYMTGPGFTDPSLQLELNVQNVMSQRNISNIIATIDGKYEKDKFVIIGAHVDSWTKGGVDSATGYGVIWELARGFGALVHKGWRPRRTIMFALWDASKYGHIGSFEWVQEYEIMLGRGAVAYINLDSVIRGNYSFHAEGDPLLYSIIKKATESVPCTDPDYYDKSVYNMWLQRFMDPGKPSQPKINPLNGDSDHTPFEYYLGVPSVSPMYTFNPKLYPHLPTYPAFSTLEDTKEYVEVFLDKNTTLQQTVSKVVADMTLRLADSAVIPFDVDNYAHVFDRGKKYLREIESVISSADVDIAVLLNKIDLFIEESKSFAYNLSSLELDSMRESELYLFNDKLLQLPRVFISREGIPGYPQYRHLLLSPHPENLWDDQVFPGIVATVDECRDNKNCGPLRHQIALLIVSVHQAIEIIQDEIFAKIV